MTLFTRFDREGLLHHQECLFGEGHAERLVEHLSESMAITKADDRKPWFRSLSNAYAKDGIEHKTTEHNTKANPPKKWGEA